MTCLVSSCLYGIQCRWHGKKVPIPKIIKQIKEPIIHACPELLGGLPCPRPPVKRKGDQIFETCPEKENRKNVTGKDLTKEFKKGAYKTLILCAEHDIDTAYLCRWSPSCDKNGVTGKLLIKYGIEVINV